ncbi:acetoin utilization protein AcuC [Luedemannella flava]|uniref:Acetoin utilization protein AcuC n=1 Tax=Luedemannella flava TaxID=349316 RepID=A0ABN2M765_9ACTN
MTTLVVWGEELLGYDLGEHPLNPVRVELAMALAREFGVLDRPGVRVVAPEPADDAALTRVHDAKYLDAVRAAARDARSALAYGRWGLGTSDNPVFERMHEASALVAGATLAAAEAVWRGEATAAASIAGGLHHAMPAKAAGFCVYNDPAVAIARLLDLGAQRIAYVDIDVHHGDGVEAIFYDDPRVLTISLHESPLSLFPGTGFADETGGPDAPGSAVNVALPAGTGDQGWLRAFHAVVPALLRAFRPELIVAQCGADTHRLDPLADLRLTVDGQRAAQLAVRDLAVELCDGRWVATGGGGYALVVALPRAWAHLLATVTGEPLEPGRPTPPQWRALAAQRLTELSPGARRVAGDVPPSMTDFGDTTVTAWDPDSDHPVDRAVRATRRAVFPLHGLDPYDPRD